MQPEKRQITDYQRRYIDAVVQRLSPDTQDLVAAALTDIHDGREFTADAANTVLAKIEGELGDSFEARAYFHACIQSATAANADGYPVVKQKQPEPQEKEKPKAKAWEPVVDLPYEENALKDEQEIECESKDFEAISRMDHPNNSEHWPPVGEIIKGPGNKMISTIYLNKMRRPVVQKGFLNASVVLEDKPKKKQTLPVKSPRELGDNQYFIIAPAKCADRLVVPIRCRPVASDMEGIEIIEPDSSSPNEWRLTPESASKKPGIFFEHDENPIPVDVSVHLPTVEEMREIRKQYPLPPKIHEDCMTDPDKIPNIIAQYVSENFTYVCHNDLWRFLETNKEDWPLILDSIKMGHCDLLSWITALYMRSYGVPALVTSECIEKSVRGHEGFDAIGHARVAVFMQDGAIKYYDPSRQCSHDHDLNKQNNHEFYYLAEDYRYYAKTEEDKRSILNTKFSVEMEVLRGKSSSTAMDELMLYKYEVLPDFYLGPNYDRVAICKTVDFHAGESDFTRLITHPYFNDLELDWERFPYHREFFSGLIQQIRSQKIHYLSSPYSSSSTKGPKSRFIFVVKKEDSYKSAKAVLDDHPNLCWHPYYDMDQQEIDGFVSDDFEFSADFKFYLSRYLEHLESEDTNSIGINEMAFQFSRQRQSSRLSIEIAAFAKLLTRSLKDRKLRERLKKEFALSENLFKGTAYRILDNYSQDGTVKDVRRSLRAARVDKDGKEAFNYQRYYEHVKVNSNDEARARRQAQKLLKELQEKARSRAKDSDSFKLVEYIPGEHDVRHIDWNATARLDKAIVKVPEMQNVPKSDLYVFVDIANVDKTVCPFASLEIMVDEIRRHCNADQKIFLASSATEHYIDLGALKKGKRVGSREIAAALIGCAEIVIDSTYYDEQTAFIDEYFECHGPYIQGGKVPENFIYMAFTQASAAAGQYLYGGKSRNAKFTCFPDEGMDVTVDLR